MSWARRYRRPLLIDLEAGLLVSEWMPSVTLDGAAQRDPSAARRAAPAAVAGLGRIELAFRARISEAEPYAYEMDYDRYLGGDYLSHFGGGAERVRGAVRANRRGAAARRRQLEPSARRYTERAAGDGRSRL